MNTTGVFILGVLTGVMVMAALQLLRNFSKTRDRIERTPMIPFDMSEIAELKAASKLQQRKLGQETGDPEDPSKKPSQWNGERDRQALTLYSYGKQLHTIAAEIGVAHDQLVARLVTLLLNPSEPLTEHYEGSATSEPAAGASATQYTEEQTERIREAFADRVPLADLAAELGRTEIAVGARILELQLPVVQPQQLRATQL